MEESKMENNTYTSISEMLFYTLHDENDEEIVVENKVEKQPEWIEFDMKPIIDLALDTRDFEWAGKLTSK
jgi:hypothetical protein